MKDLVRQSEFNQSEPEPLQRPVIWSEIFAHEQHQISGMTGKLAIL